MEMGYLGLWLVFLGLIGILFLAVRLLFFRKVLCPTCKHWGDCRVTEGAVECSRYEKERR